MPILLGLLKGVLLGGLIGGGLGFGYYQLGLAPGVLSYLFYGIIGALVGFVVGKPFWKHKTIWTPVFKAVFGFGVCLGLYALAHHFVGGLSLSFIEQGATLSKTTYVLGAAVGIVYGIFVGIDDSVGDKDEGKDDKPKKKTDK